MAPPTRLCYAPAPMTVTGTDEQRAGGGAWLARALLGGRHRLFLVAAAANLVLHRARSLATLICLVAVVTPLLVAAAIGEALSVQAQAQVEAGPDLLVSGDHYGRTGTVSLALAEEIRQIPGVLRVTPRVVARLQLEGRTLTLLATDSQIALPGALLAEGRAPQPGPGPDEAVVGAAVAAQFGAYPGLGIAIDGRRTRLLRIVGLFSPSSPPGLANVIWTPFAAAERLYDRPGEATELLVETRPGYAQRVTEAIGASHRALRLPTRPLGQGCVERGYALRTGSFALLWLLLLAATVPVVAVTSGFGLRERQREIALLRALGWHRSEIFELGLLEEIFLGLGATVAAGLRAWTWVRFFHGAGIAMVLLPGAGLTPEVPIPAIFLPVPLLLTSVTVTTVLLLGSLVATWRAAAVTPAAVLR